MLVQQHLASSKKRGEDRSDAIQSLHERDMRQVYLLQGAAGVGKSVLLTAMKEMTRNNLGKMVQLNTLLELERA